MILCLPNSQATFASYGSLSNEHFFRIGSRIWRLFNDHRELRMIFNPPESFDANRAGSWNPLSRLSSVSQPLCGNPIRGEIFTLERCEFLLKLILTQTSAPADSYICSPGYYNFTGRKGARIHTDGTNLMCVVAKHPNIDNVQLIFPSICADPEKGDEHLLSVVPSLLDQNQNVRIARLSDAATRRLLAKSEGNETFTLQEVPEDVLDWKYPIYVLNTDDVLKRVGGGFEQIRQRLRKLDRNELQIEPLDPTKSVNELLSFIQTWAASLKRTHPYHLHDLIQPSRAILDIFQTHPKKFSGQVIRMSGAIVSFALWEIPLIDGMPANEFAVASCHRIKGLSEWQIVTMCEQLNETGIRQVNIGGSEVIGLDRFKRKFNPEITEVLHSLEVIRR